MFEFVRTHTKVLMGVLFVIIVPAFVLVGVDGFTRINAGGATVAVVGNQNIKQEEWDAAHKNAIERIRQERPGIDLKLLDSPQARYASLERLVRERVLRKAMEDAHLTTTDARLATELQRDPQIAQLRKPDGTMDMERYRQLAASQGLTTDGFEAQVRRDLSLRQLESGVVATAFSPPAQADVALNAFFERREVQVASFFARDFAGKVSVSDSDIETFYQANTALFQAPETAQIEYVVLDMEGVKKTIQVNEQDIKTYYEQNALRLSGKEERRASHILISADKSAPAADREKAKARAQSLLEQVRKAPDTFADVARKNSEDSGSAPGGGDLDFFGRGAMVKPFEDAAFALKKGDISDVVESDFGFHIIRVTDVKTPKQKSFEELRPGIEADLKAQQAQRKYAEVAEIFSNGVYEQSDSLKPVADKLKLEIRTANQVQRKPVPGQSGLLANAKLLDAIFNADSIEKRRNTEAVDIGTNQLVSARIVQYAAAQTLPLAQVGQNVRERLIANRAAEMARKEGELKLQAWMAAPASAALPVATVISREPGTSVPPAILDAAMKAESSKLPVWTGVDLGVQGYAIVKVNKVLPRNPATESIAKQERAQVAQWVGSAENLAYYNLLKSRYKVQIKVAKPTDINAAGKSAD